MESEDRALNEVTKVTDMAYVPVIMADGSIGQIAKSDLASVVAGVMPLANGGKQGATRFEYKISMTQNKTYKISSSNQYAGYSFCITMYEDGKSNYIIGNLPFYRYDTCKIQSLKSSEKINFYKRVESDKWAYYVKLDDNANCIMTVNTSSVIDVVETTEDISSMTQIIPSIDNFGYNSLDELSAGVADSLKLNSFTSNGVLGTSQTDWVQIAKDVVASVKDNGTFSVIHNHKGQRYVYGYIYADKLYGTVNIQMYEGYTKTVDVNNGVYTLRG